MKTKLVLLMEDFGDWWKKQREPVMQDYVKYKISKDELNDLPSNTKKLNQLADLLGFKIENDKS